MTKSEFLSLRRDEFPKTLKLLRFYPDDRRDLKPSPIIRSAVETLNTFINEEGINLSYATTGAFDMMNFKWAEPPATMAAGIAKLEALAADNDIFIMKKSVGC